VAGHRFPATVIRSAPDPRAVLAALRAGACYLSVGPVIDLQVAAGGNEVTLGQRLELGPRASASVRLTLEGLEAPAVVRLIVGGALHLQREVEDDATLEADGILPALGGVRVEVWDRRDRVPLVLSNPVELLR
jgi:hypothetical protein